VALGATVLGVRCSLAAAAVAAAGRRGGGGAGVRRCSGGWWRTTCQATAAAESVTATWVVAWCQWCSERSPEAPRWWPSWHGGGAPANQARRARRRERSPWAAAPPTPRSVYPDLAAPFTAGRRRHHRIVGGCRHMQCARTALYTIRARRWIRCVRCRAPSHARVRSSCCMHAYPAVWRARPIYTAAAACCMISIADRCVY
jgi:hypothetical protein